MKELAECVTPEEINKISMAFIHIAEIMQSNARPFRVNQEEEEALIKQSKLNEVELAYYRNKNSQKLTEMTLRYKTLFKQLEKSVKKLRGDNIKLIEEFNMLTNEHKKLNNLRRMIKESIKELLGDEYTSDIANSSDDEPFKQGKKKD